MTYSCFERSKNAFYAMFQNQIYDYGLILFVNVKVKNLDKFTRSKPLKKENAYLYGHK